MKPVALPEKKVPVAEKKIEKIICGDCGKAKEGGKKDAFVKGLCRTCYARVWARSHPSKKGKMLMPRKSRQGEDVVEKMMTTGEKLVVPTKLRRAKTKEEQEGGAAEHIVIDENRDIMDIPVERLTLKDIADAGGTVSIVPVSGSFSPDFGKIKMELDFGKYPGIYTKLCEMAQANFRTPELQIFAILDMEAGI